MIIFKYLEGWDANLVKPKLKKTTCQQIPTMGYHSCDHLVSWTDFIAYAKQNNHQKTQKNNHLNVHLLDSEDLTQNTSKLAQHILQKILSQYDSDDCIYGLFSALSQAKNRVSPFIATHSYCAKIYSCATNGQIHFTVSPIYHLGPDYPEQYKRKYGTEIDQNAIIGLIQTQDNDFDISSQPTFAIGIDAGIIFKHSKIPHNRDMLLELNAVDDGIMANLSCESQITSKKFTWKSLGFEIPASNESQSLQSRA